MKNAWLSGASATPPAAPSSPSLGYPTDGSPGVTPPTIPGAYAFHAITTELLNVITAAGITPSLTTLTQLKSAMDKLYGVALLDGGGTPYGFTVGGLVVQWKTVAFSDVPSGIPGQTGTVTFTQPFTHACLVAVPVTEASAGSTSNWNASITAKTTTGASFQIQEWSAGVNPGSLTLLAIGW